MPELHIGAIVHPDATHLEDFISALSWTAEEVTATLATELADRLSERVFTEDGAPDADAAEADRHGGDPYATARHVVRLAQAGHAQGALNLYIDRSLVDTFQYAVQRTSRIIPTSPVTL